MNLPNGKYKVWYEKGKEDSVERNGRPYSVDQVRQYVKDNLESLITSATHVLEFELKNGERVNLMCGELR